MSSDWTPERVEMLKDLCAAGLSASKMGRALGISRNAALGKAHRMGFKVHGGSGGGGTHREKPRAPSPTRPRLVIPKEPPAPVTFIGPIGDFPPPGTCRFIQGDVSHPNWRSCGNPVAKTGSSWCSTDARRFLQASYRGNGCCKVQQGAGMSGPDFRDPFRQRPLQKRSIGVQFNELGIDPMGRSPLEQRLGLAILELMLDPGQFGPPGFLNLFLPQYEIHSLDDFPPVRPIKEGVINVAPGTWWDSYQADFLFHVKAPASRKPVWGALECDGHDFHEATPEQVSHDRQRDRDFQAAGINILRFPGWQVQRDPHHCARETIKILLRRSAAGRAA